MPAGTVAIAGDAFRDCVGLAQVTLPVTVTRIESLAGNDDEVGAFTGCCALRKITLPPNLAKISLEGLPSPIARP